MTPMPDAGEMTRVAEDLAVAAGFEKADGFWVYGGNVPFASDDNPTGHPFPVGSLDAVAKALPEKYEWLRVWRDFYTTHENRWWAEATTGKTAPVTAYAPDEWTARARCCIAAWKVHKPAPPASDARGEGEKP